MKFPQNIRYLRNKKGFSQEGLANELDLSRNQIASYEDGRAHPSLDTLVKYSEFFQLPIDALVKSDLTHAKDGTFMDIGNNRILFPVLIDEDNKDMIEVVTKESSAGYLRGYSDPEYISELKAMKLPFLPTGKHRAFPISGDSMEPMVRDGAYVIGEFVGGLEELKDNQCYVILTASDGPVFKRISLEKIHQGILILKSDNKQYAPYEVAIEDTLEYWSYTCSLNIGQYKAEELNLNSIMAMLRELRVELKMLKGAE
ncbi:MAG: LexA family transcriptional regulator [Crocinitomicaceae bacterium]|nr:LexA family transcriptional regulator [Crocinitomicaceae bacterium]